MISADVSVAGGEQPAVRVRLDAARMAAAGIGLEEVRKAIAAANLRGALGAVESGGVLEVITADHALSTAEEFAAVRKDLGLG